jgi:uncharacterized SAM-binding protein YcdF (DUF218 family)
MFLFKKIISAFLMPVPIGLILLFIALIYLILNSYKKAKIYLILSITWFGLLCFQPFANAILAPLENTHKALLLTPNVEYIVVLGNAHASDDSLSITSQVKTTAINRLIEGIRHYNNLENAKLILSGYSGFDKNTHASMQEKLAISLGVKKEDIIRLDTPNDTRNEAIETKKILASNAFILVTSASHMKRSMLFFKKEGLNAIASPTNHLVFEDKGFHEKFSSKNLEKVEVAFHEYLGLAWAYFRGYI